MQTLAHPEGEIGTSKACAANNTLMGLSNYSCIELEKVIAHGTGNPYVIQMSLLKNKAAMIQMIKRAEGELIFFSCFRFSFLKHEYYDKSLTFTSSCGLQGTIRHA
jgi:hypothetical protein